jgi:hypothetical protein
MCRTAPVVGKSNITLAQYQGMKAGVASMIGSATPPDESFAQNIAMDVFLPASGHHNNTGGALVGVGQGGIYWSSTCTSTWTIYALGYSETFMSACIAYLSNNNRHAFTVRCVVAD